MSTQARSVGGRPRKPEGEAAVHVFTMKMSERDGDLLRRLVDSRAAELAKLTGQSIPLTTAGLIRWLVEREARARGLLEEPATNVRPMLRMVDAPPTQVPAKTKPAKKVPSEPETPEAVRALALAALDASGLSKAELARAAGVDTGQFSRFMSEKGGLGAEKLQALAREARKHAK